MKLTEEQYTQFRYLISERLGLDHLSAWPEYNLITKQSVSAALDYAERKMSDYRNVQTK